MGKGNNNSKREIAYDIFSLIAKDIKDELVCGSRNFKIWFNKKYQAKDGSYFFNTTNLAKEALLQEKKKRRKGGSKKNKLIPEKRKLRNKKKQAQRKQLQIEKGKNQEKALFNEKESASNLESGKNNESFLQEPSYQKELVSVTPLESSSLKSEDQNFPFSEKSLNFDQPSHQEISLVKIESDQAMESVINENRLDHEIRDIEVFFEGSFNTHFEEEPCAISYKKTQFPKKWRHHDVPFYCDPLELSLRNKNSNNYSSHSLQTTAMNQKQDSSSAQVFNVQGLVILASLAWKIWLHKALTSLMKNLKDRCSPFSKRRTKKQGQENYFYGETSNFDQQNYSIDSSFNGYVESNSQEYYPLNEEDVNLYESIPQEYYPLNEEDVNFHGNDFNGKDKNSFDNFPLNYNFPYRGSDFSNQDYQNQRHLAFLQGYKKVFLSLFLSLIISLLGFLIGTLYNKYQKILQYCSTNNDFTSSIYSFPCWVWRSDWKTKLNYISSGRDVDLQVKIYFFALLGILPFYFVAVVCAFVKAYQSHKFLYSEIKDSLTDLKDAFKSLFDFGFKEEDLKNFRRKALKYLVSVIFYIVFVACCFIGIKRLRTMWDMTLIPPEAKIRTRSRRSL